MADTPETGTFILDSAALTSILDAVNQLIFSLGEAPVATYDPSPSTDVDGALICINEADKAVQRKGWEWNRDYNVSYTPASDGTIQVGPNCMRAVLSYAASGNMGLNSYNGQGVKVVLRGQKLYDQTNQTYTFTSPLLLDTISRMTWDEIPESYRAWIVLDALRRFQSSVQQSAVKLQFNEQDLKEARANAEAEQDDESKQNAITGNVHALSALYGVGGMRRNRGGY